jgi:hypothetical protein
VVAKRRVPPPRVVEAFDVLEERAARLSVIGKSAPV